MTETQREFYVQCVQNGCTPKMAEMLALQSPPGVKTDSTYLANSQTVGQIMRNGHRHDRAIMARTIENARKQGYNPSPEDVYEPQLARNNGDPMAFVPADSPRHHIQKFCEETGRECNGVVNVKHREPERDPLDTPKGLAPDILHEKMSEEVKKNPALTRLKRKAKRAAVRELKEKIIATHGV